MKLTIFDISLEVERQMQIILILEHNPQIMQ